MKVRIQRWRYIVDWSLQGTLVFHGLIYGAIVMLAVSLGIFSPLLWELGGVERNGSLEEQSIVMLYLHDRFWMIAAVCLTIVVVGAIRFSHRIAGPMVRFKRNLRMMAHGQIPSPLRTRRADFLKDEVQCLNEAVAGVSKRLKAVAEAQDRLCRVVASATSSSRDRSIQLEQIADACEELGVAIGQFDHIRTTDERPIAPLIALEPELVGEAGGV
jgi:hypothetical protein